MMFLKCNFWTSQSQLVLWANNLWFYHTNTETGKNLKREIKEENRHPKEQNLKLKSEAALVNKRINIIEQELISKHIELIGLPEQKNENCINIVEDISLAVGEKINVENAYRLRSKMFGKLGKIIVVLKSIKEKQNFKYLVITKRLLTLRRRVFMSTTI